MSTYVNSSLQDPVGKKSEIRPSPAAALFRNEIPEETDLCSVLATFIAQSMKKTLRNTSPNVVVRSWALSIPARRNGNMPPATA